MVSVGARTVREPSGQEWRVGRRWISRRMPRWRKVRMGKVRAEDAADALSIPEIVHQPPAPPIEESFEIPTAAPADSRLGAAREYH